MYGTPEIDPDLGAGYQSADRHDCQTISSSLASASTLPRTRWLSGVVAGAAALAFIASGAVTVMSGGKTPVGWVRLFRDADGPSRSEAGGEGTGWASWEGSTAENLDGKHEGSTYTYSYAGEDLLSIGTSMGTVADFLMRWTGRDTVPASLHQYLPSAINITLDREVAAGEIGDAAVGGHVAFVLSKKNETTNFISYVVVMDLFGNITRFEPIYDFSSSTTYHGLALKLKNSSTIMMAVHLQDCVLEVSTSQDSNYFPFPPPPLPLSSSFPAC